MRQLTSHAVNICNQSITIDTDEPDPVSNMPHEYVMRIHPGPGRTLSEPNVQALRFQNGPIGEVGVNGVTHEVLLAILIDRLQGAQKSKYACRENALALTKLEEAAQWLEARTKARVARGVEGTHTV
jgi:hypothetical protein